MSIYGTKTAEEMGKKEKEHRKKVQARNQKLVAARKKLGKELQAEFAKQAGAHSQTPIYASTGDFIAKHYDKITEQGSTEYLEQHSGVEFSR
jgi:DNA-binding XRE family transcriptional regulator